MSNKKKIPNSIHTFPVKRFKLIFNDKGIASAEFKVKIHKLRQTDSIRIIILEHKYYSFIINIDIKTKSSGEIITSMTILTSNTELANIDSDDAFSYEFKRISHFEVDVFTTDKNLYFSQKLYESDVIIPTNRFIISYPNNKEAFIIDQENSDWMTLTYNLHFKLVEDFTPREVDDWTPRVLEKYT
jgi:hypothetical protein